MTKSEHEMKRCWRMPSAAPKPIQQESKDTEILRAAQVLCKQLTGDDTFGWNPELLAQIADCTAALLATNGISSHFPSANTEPICSWEKPVVEYQRPDYALEYGTNY